MRVLVCGGRKYRNEPHVFHVLDQIHADEIKISCIIEGEASGADQLAALWASRRGVPIEPYPADWNRYGDAAGPIRNTEMLAKSKPDLVVAFPGGLGTADMIKKAKKAGVRVIRA